MPVRIPVGLYVTIKSLAVAGRQLLPKFVRHVAQAVDDVAPIGAFPLGRGDSLAYLANQVMKLSGFPKNDTSGIVVEVSVRLREQASSRNHMHHAPMPVSAQPKKRVHRCQSRANERDVEETHFGLEVTAHPACRPIHRTSNLFRSAGKMAGGAVPHFREPAQRSPLPAVSGCSDGGLHVLPGDPPPAPRRDASTRPYSAVLRAAQFPNS